MKALLTIVIFISITFFGYAQFAFKNDTSFKIFSLYSLNQIDSSFHLNKDNDFELRLWSVNTLVQLRTLFILSYKNKTWTGRFFKMAVNSKGEFVEYKIDDSNLESAWKILLQNKVLTIPTESKLRDKKGKIPDINLRDGTSYWFELLTPISKRNYYYSCPKTYSENYRYIKSFKRVVDIISVINKIARVKYGPC